MCPVVQTEPSMKEAKEIVPEKPSRKTSTTKNMHGVATAPEVLLDTAALLVRVGPTLGK